MNAVIKQETIPSIIGDMAERYGMDRRAFESTVRQTLMPSDVNPTNEQIVTFLLVAKQYDLNPFTKEIFAFPSRGGIQPVVSVDGWLNIINRHPQFDGMEFTDQLDGSGKLVSVTCKMFRKDRSHPIVVTEYMTECVRTTDTWKRWPARMLRHKATIQAARYAFGFSGIMEPDEAERMIEATQEVVATVSIPDTRKKRHDEAYEQYEASVLAIKEAIAKEDYYTAAECWGEIPQAAQIDLWLAPTKGGCFTTHERKVIHDQLPRDSRPEATEASE